jgi:excisionase family DNA binding protein
MSNDDKGSRRFLDATEAAEFLGGLNSRTVSRWAREGYLPSYPMGEGKRRLWRFLASDLEQWMIDRRTGPVESLKTGKALR